MGFRWTILSAPSEIPSLLLLPVCSALFFQCPNVFSVLQLSFVVFLVFEIALMSAGSSEEASW